MCILCIHTFWQMCVCGSVAVSRNQKFELFTSFSQSVFLNFVTYFIVYIKKFLEEDS